MSRASEMSSELWEVPIAGKHEMTTTLALNSALIMATKNLSFKFLGGETFSEEMPLATTAAEVKARISVRVGQRAVCLVCVSRGVVCERYMSLKMTGARHVWAYSRSGRGASPLPS